MVVMTLGNFDSASVSKEILASSLLKLSQYNEKRKAEAEQAKATYLSIVNELRNNFDKPTSLYGLEPRIIDLLEFVSVEDLQKEFVFFNEIADDLEKKANLLKKQIETDFDKTKIKGDISKEQERDKLLDDANKILDRQKQALKVAIMFGTAIKEKERKAEKERREIVGAKLRMVREMKGLSQTDVAQALGTNKSLVANYETGYREPSIKNLIKLAKILNISSDWLLDIPIPKYEPLLQQAD